MSLPFLSGHQTLLPGLHWRDEQQVTLPGNLTARQAHDLLFAETPIWAHGLMRLRNAMARPLRLTTVGMGDFPEVSCDEREIVLGLDDRHLDFRIRIASHPIPGGKTAVTVATLVRFRSFLGRLYLAAVTPFHHAIVRTMLHKAEQTPQVVAAGSKTIKE